eukprot:TRINITY_DN940_c5_g1_i1.p1 TRINITY_DN940_c5_g1~~TRINITY_DN940_c5_g1_i1.p1  ORF type:complete len:1114 (+),score=202.39 TRINITY_DN940_c5_g1_i1:40-3342(+)
MIKPSLVLGLVQLVLTATAARVCSEEDQKKDRVVKDMLEVALAKDVLENGGFEIILHWGPTDRWHQPSMHEVFEVGCGDKSTTIPSDDMILSAFTNNCFYQSGNPVGGNIGTGGTPQDAGCDTWIEIKWTDPQGLAINPYQNYTVMSLNSDGVPLWVVHSVKSASIAQDLTNCWAPTEDVCKTKHSRHNCVWQPSPNNNVTVPWVNRTNLVGTNQAYGRCAGNNALGGHVDLNYHGPIDLNMQLGSQAQQPGQVGGGTADSYYAGYWKKYFSQGQQLQGRDRITFLLFRNEVFDHPPWETPWLPVADNLHLSFKRQFLEPIGVLWYWTHGLDNTASKYKPFACSIVPSLATWNESVEVSFDCEDCQGIIADITTAAVLASSDQGADKAWDLNDDSPTQFKAWDPTGGWTRAEFLNPRPVTRLRFRPPPGQGAQMINGRFTALPETPGSLEVLLGQIYTQPADWPTWTEMYYYPQTTAERLQQFKYVTYHGAAGTHSVIADVEVFFSCSGNHATESDVVKAVREGESCDSPAAYYTTEDRTDLECLFKNSAECYSFQEKCFWETATEMCQQKVIASRRTFTFYANSSNPGSERVQFCYEGQKVFPNGTMTINEKDTSTDAPPTLTPIKSPPVVGATPRPGGVGGLTPYPVVTYPPDTDAPPTGTPTSIPVTNVPKTSLPVGDTLSPVAVQPSTFAPLPTRPPLLPSDLALDLVGTTSVGNSIQGVYDYLKTDWNCVSGIPCKTIIFIPRSPVVVTGASPEVTCRLLSDKGTFQSDSIVHTLPSTLTGGGPIQMVSGRAVFLELTVTMPYNLLSSFDVSCFMTATDIGAGTRVTGEPHQQKLLLSPNDGSQQLTIRMRVGTETPPSDEYIRSTLQELYGSQSDRVIIGQQATSLVCLEDPSIVRSSQILLTSPSDNTAVSNLRILKDATNTTSDLSQRLCGIIEAFQSPSNAGTGFTSLPSGVLPTVNPGGGGGGGGNVSVTPPPESGGDSTIGIVLLVIIIVLVVLCCVGFFLWRRYRANRAKKEAIAEANKKQRDLDYQSESGYQLGSPAGSQAGLRESDLTQGVTENPLIGNFPVKEVSVISSENISVKDSSASDITRI